MNGILCESESMNEIDSTAIITGGEQSYVFYLFIYLFNSKYSQYPGG